MQAPELPMLSGYSLKGPTAKNIFGEKGSRHHGPVGVSCGQGDSVDHLLEIRTDYVPLLAHKRSEAVISWRGIDGGLRQATLGGTNP